LLQIKVSVKKGQLQIVISSMVRTRQTAQPLISRFNHVPVETWPIQEFCYLSQARCSNTTWQERLPWVESYWSKADPNYCDGDGSESFSSLVQRVRETLKNLMDRQQQGHQRVAMFGHGQFLSIMLDCLRFQNDTASAERMKQFRSNELQQPIENAKGFAAKKTVSIQGHSEVHGWIVLS
jgi:broad specificity phosphatase PhoE